MNDRERFEKHTKEVLGLCVVIGVDGEYESDRTRENWITWQAAHAESALRKLLMKVAQEVDRQYRGQSQPMTLEAIVDRVLESKL